MASTRVDLPNVWDVFSALTCKPQLMALVAATFRNCPKVDDDDDAIPDTKAVSPEMKGHHFQMPSNFISVD